MTEQEFIEELSKINIQLTKDQLEKLNQFYEFLIKTNEVINLTRITDKKDVYLKHFYDSLTIYKVVDLTKNITLCDVGTGAGFPGIVLKIAFPNLKITLIDSLQKRINYLNDLIKILDLKDIETIHTRSEEYAKENREKYDIVTSRAVANLRVLSEITIPLVKINGLFIAMKANLENELEESSNIIDKLDCTIEKIESFKLPFENSIRNLVVIKKIKQTDKKYPRSIDRIKKDIYKSNKK